MHLITRQMGNLETVERFGFTSDGGETGQHRPKNPGAQRETTAIKPLIKSEISFIPQQPSSMSLLSTTYLPSLYHRYIRPRRGTSHDFRPS